MAGPQEVKIEQSQAATWATEATLRRLLNESNTTRGVIEKYLSKIEDWDEKQLEEARNFSRQAQRENDRTVNATNQGFDSLGRGLQGVSSGLTGSVGQIVKGLGVLSSTSGIGNLSSASNMAASALAVASTNLGGFAQGALLASAELLGLVGAFVAIAHMVDDLNDNFSKLYDSGINVAGGLNGLVDISKYMELTTGETAKVLSEFGSTVTILGTQRTAQLIKEFRNLTKQGSIFGYNLEQTAEAVLEYAEIVRSTGGLSSESVEQLAKDAKRFNEEISLTSQVTGQSRKEIMKGLKTNKDRMAIESALPDAMKKNLPVLKAQFAALGDSGQSLFNNLENYIQMGAYGLDENLRNFLASSGLMGSFEAMASDAAAGGANARSMLESFADTIANTSQEEIKRYTLLAQGSGPAAEMAKQFLALYGDMKNQSEATKKQIAEAKEYMKTHKEITSLEKAREIIRQKREAEVNATNERTQRVQNVLESATKQLTLVFQKLVINVLEPLLPGLEMLGNGVIWLSEIFKNVIDDFRAAIKSFSDPIDKSIDIFYNLTERAWIVATIFGKLTSQLYDATTTAIPNFIKGLIESIPGLSTVVGFISDKWTKLYGVFDGVMGKVTSTFKQLGDALSGWFGWIWAPRDKGEAKAKEREYGPAMTTPTRGMGEEIATLGMEGGLTYLLGKWLKNKVGGMFGGGAGLPGGGATPDAAEIATQAKSVAETVTKAKSTLGESISTLTGGIKDSLGKLAIGIKDGVTALGQGIANVLGSLTKAIGTGFIKIAEGTASAITILGKALQGLGPGAIEMTKGSLALAAAITLIGGAIAADIWMFGEALPTFSAGLNSLTALDAAKLGAVGSALQTLGVGMLSFGGGEMAASVGGFTTWVSGFFNADPLSKIKEISALSTEVSALNSVSDALIRFAESYKNLSDSLKNPIPVIDSANLIKTVQSIQKAVDTNLSTVPTEVSPASAATPGTIAAKTVEYYEQSRQDSRNMQDMLLQIKMSLDNLNNSINSQTSTLSKSIVKASPIIS